MAKEFGMETEESVANIATEAGIEFTGPVKNGSKTATVSDIKKIKNWQQEQESPIKKQPPVVEEEIVEGIQEEIEDGIEQGIEEDIEEDIEEYIEEDIEEETGEEIEEEIEGEIEEIGEEIEEEI